MIRRLLTAVCCGTIAAHARFAGAPADFKLVTASERGTYILSARELARHIAPLADIELEVLPSAGSAENVRRLRYEPGVKLAVYQAFLDQAAGGNAEAGEIIRPLRVITPLYNKEIYFIAAPTRRWNRCTRFAAPGSTRALSAAGPR